MIGTIRKHSKWLWGIVIVATIVTFVFWGTNPGGRSGGGTARNLGSIDGQKVTTDDYVAARNDVFILYWLRTGQWPDRDPNFTQRDMQLEIYKRLFLIQQGQKLGIHIGQDAVATAAQGILSSPGLGRMFGVEGRSVPLSAFVKNVLRPKGLTAGDFENFVRDDLLIQQVQQAKGLAGELVTPQEVAAVYRHEYQEREAQIVFFSASNYLASVPVTTNAVDQFYTNYLAEYRLPERVSVSYVAFEVTNFMAEAKKKLTNLTEQVDAIYNRYGTNAVPDAGTPEEAKAKLRELLVRQQALSDARQKADDFASDAFKMEPVKPENLATAAKQKDLVVHVTAPFGKQYGPKEFTAPADFIKSAFGLTPDEPLAGPIAGPHAVYVIAFNKKLPSEIPPLSRIRDRVRHDYEMHEATLHARAVGTNFVHTLESGLAGGKSFSAVCTANGLRPETLPAFALSTTDLPEVGDRAPLNEVKAVTFGTEIHHASNFVPTDTGGFIVYVKSQLPLDVAAMNANLPQFADTLRRQRESAAFYNWLEQAGSRALSDTPIAQGQGGNDNQ